jgi:ketosteroid isomerase-like protein
VPGGVAQRVERACVRPGRTAVERAMVRSPRAYAAVAALGTNVSPRSRLRQRALLWGLASGYAAFHRQDLDLMLVRYSPDVVYETVPELTTLGLPARTDGHEGMRAAFGEFFTSWAQWSLTIHSVIDCGDFVVTLSSVAARGLGSGAEIELEFGQLVEPRGGLVGRERDFYKWTTALDAAGVDAGLLERLEELPPGATVEF